MFFTYKRVCKTLPNVTTLYPKAGHRSNLASLRFRVNAATERRKHTQVDFFGLRSAFEQSLCFRSTGNVWTPAYSLPCYRRQDARVEHALLEQLTLFPNASIDSIHGQRNPHRERGLAGMGNGCFAEFCCCVPLCPCELRYSSSKDISFHRFPGDKVAGRECIFKSRRDMPLL